MPIPMTVNGAESLRVELAQRKGEIRQSIVKDISEARAHGDLKENAEYHAAREQQSLNEGRIQDIESKLADAQVIDVNKILRIRFGNLNLKRIACRVVDESEVVVIELFDYYQFFDDSFV